MDFVADEFDGCSGAFFYRGKVGESFGSRFFFIDPTKPMC